MSTNQKIIDEWALPYGRIISPSKTAYCNKYPNNLVVFNANICLENGTKIWHGDLDISIDEKHLKELASGINQTIYVLREMDIRFVNETKPLLEHFVCKAYPENKKVELSEDTKMFFSNKRKIIRKEICDTKIARYFKNSNP